MELLYPMDGIFFGIVFALLGTKIFPSQGTFESMIFLFAKVEYVSCLEDITIV